MNYLILLNLLTLISIAFVIFFIRKIVIKINHLSLDLHRTIEGIDDSDKESSYDVERTIREAQFDERINKLKDDIAREQSEARKGTTAMELHPLVKNLPHDEVIDYTFGEMEYSK